MTVAHGVSEFAPYVCAVYTCRCGKRAVEHSPHSEAPPPGWETWSAEQHVCEKCREKSARATSPAPAS